MIVVLPSSRICINDAVLVHKSLDEYGKEESSGTSFDPFVTPSA
jgi:hypothetical protein